MSRRFIITFAAAALSVFALTGCPSPSVVEVTAPERVDVPDERSSKRSQLAANRARNLDELHAYWTAGVFPRNEELPMVGNVFRDADGHLCAAANLMQKDGRGELVDRTARRDNFIRLAEVEDGELHEWILQSGFTQEEIAMIQVPYMPVHLISVEEERARLQQHLEAVESRLRDDTEQSLSIAVRELERVASSRAATKQQPIAMF